MILKDNYILREDGETKCVLFQIDHVYLLYFHVYLDFQTKYKELGYVKI